MALSTAWELLSATDIGPGLEDGARTIEVVAVAECPEGHLHLVQTKAGMTPEQLEVFRQRGGSIPPTE